MKRRTLLAGGAALAAASLGPGVAARGDDAEPLPPGADDALAALPAAAERDAEYPMVYYRDLSDVSDPDELSYDLRPLTQLEVDLGAIEAAVVADVPQGVTVGVAVGTVDRLERGEGLDAPSGWWLGDVATSDIAVASTDELLGFARARDPSQRREWAATIPAVIAGEHDAVRDDVEVLDDMLEHTADHEMTFVFAGPAIEHIAGGTDRPVDTLAIGVDDHPGDRTGTVADTVVIEPGEEPLPADDIDAVLDYNPAAAVVERSVETVDGLQVVDATFDLAPRRRYDAGPDAHFSISTDPDEGTAVLTHENGEPVDADRLELWIDGELADPQPGDTFETLEPGDRIELAPGPVASVFLRWLDEDGTAYRAYVDQAIGDDAFEISYMPADERLELEYVADTATVTERLQLRQHRRRETSGTELGALAGDELTSGDVVELEDVPLESAIALELDIPTRPAEGITPNTHVLTHHVRPPVGRITRRASDPPAVRFYHDVARDPGEFEIRYDGEPTETQLADLVEQIEPGRPIELPDADFGTAIEVVWTAPPEPVVVADRVVSPNLFLDVTDDPDAGTVTVSHEGGEEVPVDELAVVIDDGSEIEPDVDGDAFAPGDRFTVEVAPFHRVTVQWTDGEARAELGATVTGGDAFEASYAYDDLTVEITYVGEATADPDRLVLERYTAGVSPSKPFAAAHDELTAGDAITVEDVDPDDRLVIRLATGELDERPAEPVDRAAEVDTDEGGNVAVDAVSTPVGPDVIWEYRPLPRGGFRFDVEGGDVEMRYVDRHPRDAAAFELRVDGEVADLQPADVFDTLEPGDTMTLEGVPTGAEVVVTWVPADDPPVVDRYEVPPEAVFDVGYDDEAGTVTVRHAGGDELPAEDLHVIVQPSPDGLYEWGEDGTVQTGESRTIEDVDDVDLVVVLYQLDHPLHEERL